jgi:cysteine synthase A
MLEVGNTPLMKVDGIFAKLECKNPTGSIKDRIAKYIIDESEKRGLLKKGMKIVEATSGNTGIAFSHYARSKGYDVTIVMPGNMSEERKKLIRGFGAHLILCSDGNFMEAASIRDEMAKDPGYFNPDQFSNPLNIECHQTTTGQELIRQLRERSLKIDAFVAGVGTGGTLIGVGKALRNEFPDVKLVAVEPLESPVMSGGCSGLHGIQGIGDGFIPRICLEPNGELSQMIDEVICVSTEDARENAKYLGKEKGLCVGVSSGANYLAARQLSERYGTVVTVFSDGYSKYQSHGLVKGIMSSCEYDKKCFADTQE